MCPVDLGTSYTQYFLKCFAGEGVKNLHWNKAVLGPPIIWLIALPHVLVVGAAGWHVISEYHAIVLYRDEAARTAWMAYEPSFFWPNDEGWNSKWSEVARPLYAYLSKLSTILLLAAPLTMTILLEIFPKHWVQELQAKRVPERTKKKPAFVFSMLALFWVMCVAGVYLLPFAPYGKHRWLSCTHQSFSSCVSTHIFFSSLVVLSMAFFVWLVCELHRIQSLEKELRQ